MAEEPIGKITHYFDKVNVAVVALDGTLKTGDRIKIGKNDEDFLEQDVRSMQIDRERVEKAGKGQEIGLKIDKRVRVGDLVFKIA